LRAHKVSEKPAIKCPDIDITSGTRFKANSSIRFLCIIAHSSTALPSNGEINITGTQFIFAFKMPIWRMILDQIINFPDSKKADDMQLATIQLKPKTSRYFSRA